MNVFILLTVVLSMFLAARYLSLTITRLNLYSLRDYICIERFRCRHKLCEKCLIFYYANSMLVHIWGGILLSTFILNFSIPTILVELISSLLILLLFCQSLYRFIIERKYLLRSFYINVINLRSNIDVVSEDNDHEVNYIRIYEEYVSENKWNIIWVFYIIFLNMVFIMK